LNFRSIKPDQKIGVGLDVIGSGHSLANFRARQLLAGPHQTFEAFAEHSVDVPSASREAPLTQQCQESTSPKRGQIYSLK
jgi:hypothetical protein